MHNSQIHGFPEFRRAAYPPADAVSRFEYLDVVAFFEEELRGAEAGDAGADDADFGGDERELFERGEAGGHGWFERVWGVAG